MKHIATIAFGYTTENTKEYGEPEGKTRNQKYNRDAADSLFNYTYRLSKRKEKLSDWSVFEARLAVGVIE